LYFVDILSRFLGLKLGIVLKATQCYKSIKYSKKGLNIPVFGTDCKSALVGKMVYIDDAVVTKLKIL